MMYYLIDALQYINFLMLIILEGIGFVLFWLLRGHLKLRRDLFYLLIGIFLFCVLWRLGFGIPGRRYYLAVLFPMLPFAVVPFAVQWDHVRWPGRIKSTCRIALWIFLAATVVISCGKSLRPDKRFPLISEFRDVIKQQYAAHPPTGKVLMLDNTNRSGQILLEAGLEMNKLWIPEYKYEQQLKITGAKHITTSYIMPELPKYSDVYIIYRAADFTEIDRVVNDTLAQTGWETVLRFQSQREPVYLLYHLTRRD